MARSFAQAETAFAVLTAFSFFRERQQMNRHEMNVEIVVFVPELGLQPIKLVKQRKMTAIKLNGRAINQI